MTCICPKQEQSMKQNGSLCSVIAGNLAKVSLATKTWFLTEDNRDGAATTQTQPALASNGNSLDFVFSSVLSVVVSRLYSTPADVSFISHEFKMEKQ